jgi:hypothetical protein
VGSTLDPSDFYQLTGGPADGAVMYELVDDGQGGVYLQWVPNTTAKALGGFGGATGSGTLGASGRGNSGSNGSSSGSAIASASSAFSGAGGLGLSGGPSGGGAAGRIADLSAGNVLPADPGLVSGADAGGGSLKDGNGDTFASACAAQRGRNAWAQGETSRSNFAGGNDGRSESLSGGIETDAGSVSANDCDRVALGIFGFAGQSDTEWETGRAASDNSGVGAYIRAASSIGLYGSLLGAWNWADQDLTNSVLRSTAKRNSDGFTGVATLGYVAKIASNAAIDLRTFIAYGNINGDGFTDSVGIVVSGSEDDIVTLGGSLGLHVALNSFTQGFVRGGVKWAEVDSSITSFGITQSGSADDISGSVEAGFVAAASEGVQLGLSGFGEFSDSATSYGGRAHVGIKF